MPRDYKVRLDDILECIKKIEDYTTNVEYEEFAGNSMLQDGL